MENPLSRILERVGSIPVLGFLWAGFEILERFEFISKKAQEFSMSLGVAVSILVVCFIWLIGIGFWPVLRPKLPPLLRRWNLGKTIGERVNDIETEHVPSCSSNHAKASGRIDLIDRRLTAAEKWLSMTSDDTAHCLKSLKQVETT